ncbi:hypothetical protein Hanom_Chr09g00781701 [Helianthus anomalus]
MMVVFKLLNECPGAKRNKNELTRLINGHPGVWNRVQGLKLQFMENRIN